MLRVQSDGGVYEYPYNSLFSMAGAETGLGAAWMGGTETAIAERDRRRSATRRDRGGGVAAHIAIRFARERGEGRRSGG